MSTDIHTDAFRRLPKWAQNEIERLMSDIETSENRTAAAIGERETAIEIDPFRAIDGRPRCFLGEGAEVRFHLDGGDINIRLSGGRVEIAANAKTGDHFSVRPHVSNVVSVGFELRAKSK